MKKNLAAIIFLFIPLLLLFSLGKNVALEFSFECEKF